MYDFINSVSAMRTMIINQLSENMNYWNIEVRLYKRTECEPSQFCVCFVRVLKVYVNCRLE